MSINKVYRIFVEKRLAFAVEAEGHFQDLKDNLGIKGLSHLRLLNRYDVQGIDDETFIAAGKTIFAEPPVDVTYSELPEVANSRIFGIQYLPGQFDQRADSCSQSIQLLTQKQRPLVKSAKIFILEGNLSDAEFNQIKSYLINPVEAQEASMAAYETLIENYPVPDFVPTVEGFIAMDKLQLANLIKELGLAMDLDDIVFCQNYFQSEKRDPTLTEIRMIDTYWSDHCRHTTFSTNINNAEIAPAYIQQAFSRYLKCKKELKRENKPVCLMDIATMAMRYLRDTGKLKNLDESEEINACSVEIDVDVDHKTERWLLMFKNETHNHPTEIEPFGGAATCLGGAIRDPLSGRAYVYQAMRVTGAADPTRPIEETLSGKLPQRKIVTAAAAGYSSYGNQIGLATGLVEEIYHPNYVAKRMEIGAVVGAAPKSNVRRERPQDGDLVILLGGRTGRDGCGGATGSSKSHTAESLGSCGAEVQKGNPPEERKIQRLFRDSKVTRMIKRCNDFGAGGVSVAIGELADGLTINLDAVPKKYEGLDGTELAISESQERMAVVIDPQDLKKFMAAAKNENLEATLVAKVQAKPRLEMTWNGRTIVNISRDFLNSNGAPKNTDVKVTTPDTTKLYEGISPKGNTFTEKLLALVTNLNICSQKGLIERFDSTIGAGTVTMPFGGKYQLTPTPFMAAKIPVLQGETNTASVMAYGYNPYVSEQSPFHGAVAAVVESVTKLVAAGLDYKNLWLTLQEYFERTNNEPTRWGKPFAALLGAFTAQMELGLAAIGGKDSMSGTFENIDVPPTLVSFAIGTCGADKIITPEFKKAGNYVYLIKAKYDENNLPDFASLKRVYEHIQLLNAEGSIKSAWAVGNGGIAEAVFKMTLGNKIGFDFNDEKSDFNYFHQYYGSILIETEKQISNAVLVGRTTNNAAIQIGSEIIALDKLIEAWQKPLAEVFPITAPTKTSQKPELYSYETRSALKPAASAVKPKVLLPVFPGTNCEYDTARQFEKYGAETLSFVIGNLTADMVEASVKNLVKAIDNSQIIMLPGGFSGGDEPDGSGKFIATFFRNPRISEAVNRLLNERDGLMLGICNGFQALIKLGLVPYGEIRDMEPESPTLTYNNIGRHQSMMVQTRIASVNSPWLAYNNVGDIHTIAISHGEGRFVADAEMLALLKANGQIITQYVDLAGNPTMEMPYNPNGSTQAIEGITSPDGRIFGKMGHSERVGNHITKNVPGLKDQLIFKSGVDYFK